MLRVTENREILKIEKSDLRKKAEAKAKIWRYIVRFVLGFVIGQAKVLGNLSPFGTGYIAAFGDDDTVFPAIAGVIIGYVVNSTFYTGLKYIAASIMVFTAVTILRKWPQSKNVWFKPATAFFVTAVFAVACDLMAEPKFETVTLCICDALFAGAGAYLFKKAFSEIPGKLDFTKSDEVNHTVSVIFMLAVLMIALNSLTMLEIIAIGRIVAMLTILLFAYKGGAASGCAGGAVLGLAMDLSAGMFWYTALYGITGLVSGVFAKQGKVCFTVTAILTCGGIALMQTDSAAVPGCLYEMFVASVVFVLLPNGFMNRIEAFLPSHISPCGEQKTREYMKNRLHQAADAFSSLYETVCDAAGFDRNDSDIAAVFDAAAEKVCRNCRSSHRCWISEYETTLDALNGVSGKMLSEGVLEVSDFPIYFTDRCCDADDFTAAVNDELKGLSYRRQYRAKLMNNQKAAFGQYADMASILEGFSKELNNAAGGEPTYELRLKKYLKAKNLTDDTAVYKGMGGRVRMEISHRAASKLRRNKDWLEELSSVLGMRLCTGEGNSEYAVLMEAEPLTAAVGIAAVNKGASRYGGDKNAYFKTDEGILYVILSDGMGTGKEAERYSKNAVSVLESFLKSGIPAETAVRILNDLMLLKNQTETDCCTVDVVSIDLFSGKSSIFKYGAAASYLKRDEEVERVAGKSLAAGLGFPPEDMPDKFEASLSAGDFAIMVSDGVTSGGCDDWLFELLEKYTGDDPKELAGMIVKHAVGLFGDQDDMTAFVICVSERK